MDLGQRNAAARRVFFVDATGKDRGLAFEAGMVQQQPGQLCAGVSCDSYNRGLYCSFMIPASSLVVLPLRLPGAGQDR